MSKVKKSIKAAVIRNARKPASPIRKAAIKAAKKASDVEVKELDPFRKCGAGTSVERLYRITERLGGQTTHHLVFFDRHGWYCEHGRTCPAVGVAKKFKGRMRR